MQESQAPGKSYLGVDIKQNGLSQPQNTIITIWA